MSSSKHPGRSFSPLPEESRAGYVTQVQLEESAQRISQSFQQQFTAFTNELLSRIPLQQPSSLFFPPPPSVAQPSPIPPPAMGQPLIPPLPGCATHAGQQGDYAEYTSPSPCQQTHFTAPPRQHLQYVEAMGKSPSFGHDDREHAAGGTSRGPRYPHTALGQSATNFASGYDRTFLPIAETIRGSTPYADCIMNATYDRFKMPHMERYKGEGDPAEHA